MINFRKVEFEQVMPSLEKLWPGRKLAPHSSMLMRGGHDYKIRDLYKYRCWAAYNADNTKVVGVMMGHKSERQCYRTRGLWVDPAYRGKGIAQRLFGMAQLQAMNETCRWLWSYPRLSALGAYQKSGYIPYGDAGKGEYDDCVRAKKDLSIVTTTVWNLFENPCEDIKWLAHIDKVEKDGHLLGQNEEIRGNCIHITQHWINELWMQPEWAIGDRNPLQVIKGDLDNIIHVL